LVYVQRHVLIPPFARALSTARWLKDPTKSGYPGGGPEGVAEEISII